MSEINKKVEELSQKIRTGISELYESEKYKNHLNVMSKFHNYSVRNQLLIRLQNPTASLVMGYKQWQNNFERNVKKGERGIEILAYSPYLINVEQEKLDENGNKILDKNGNPIKEEVKVKKEAYKKVVVFDISQTDGKEIKDLYLAEDLKFEVENFKSFFSALEEISPVKVEIKNIENSEVKGYYSHNENKIVVRENMPESQTIKTLVHEIAHAKLHNKEEIKNRKNNTTNFLEVEAESVAYIVSNYLGIDTSEYSFGYIAGWSVGKEQKELISSLELIQNTSSELIESLDEKLHINLELKKENNLYKENSNIIPDNKIEKEKINNKLKEPNKKIRIKDRIKEKQNIVNQLKQEKQKQIQKQNNKL